MNVSLRQLLHTGHLGELQSGMTARQVRDLPGEPENVGGASRQHPHPSIYLYGTVEIWFPRQTPYDLTGIFWDAENKGAFRLSACCSVEDWDWMPHMHLLNVEGWLREHQVNFADLSAPADQLPSRLILSSGVHVNFNAGGELTSIYAGLGYVCK